MGSAFGKNSPSIFGAGEQIAMSLTCIQCHHIVTVVPGRRFRCPNCGSRIPPPQDANSDAPGAPELPAIAAPCAAGSTIVPSANQAGRQTASIVSLVAGLMFFVPLVAQTIGIVAGLYALSRSRDSGVRKGLAGVGLALSLAALAGWILVFIKIAGSSSGVVATAPVGLGPMRPAGASTAMEDDPQSAYAWREVTRKVQKAAIAYRRDYGRWPTSIEVMRGRSLPLAFTLPDSIHFRRVPASQADNPDWILLVSEPTRWNFEGEALARPHRFIQKVNGSSALLLAETVAQKLARDNPNEAFPSGTTKSAEQDEP